MLNPQISIITVNLNNASGLQKTIESVTSQTFKGFEYIIIDGASKDGSISVIKKFEDQITYWISEPDSGIYSAMNKGIRKSNGTYLQFVNSGDYFVNDMVLSNVFNREINGKIIYTDGFVSENKGSLEKFCIPEYIDLLFLIENRLFHPGTFIKRELFDQLGLYNENLRIISDAEFFILAFLKGISFQKVNVESIIVDPNGISRLNSVLLEDELASIVIKNLGINYYQLFQEKRLIENQLIFLKKSGILRFFLKHKGNLYINKILRLF
jgi:glycosyltransferase involved in cell wall biosynthesis